MCVKVRERTFKIIFDFFFHFECNLRKCFAYVLLTEKTVGTLIYLIFAKGMYTCFVTMT